MDKETEKYGKIILQYAKDNYRLCLREPSGLLKYPFIVPGACYAFDLWDWDSWLTGIALNIIDETGETEKYQKGCVLNFLNNVDDEGRMPIYIQPGSTALSARGNKETNIHKPCLAQHALDISKKYNDASWLSGMFPTFRRYISWYDKNSLHESGLYVWLDDFAIGVDNDPCTFYRPPMSSASIYLNCLMYKELISLSELASMLGSEEDVKLYSDKAESLKKAILDCLWDERDGLFYSADVNLLPIDKNNWLHSGCPRHWNTLIQRIEVWSSLMPLWAGLATEEQAKRMVYEHYLNQKTFYAPYGVRTLSKMEKMYSIIKSGNPSCWLGPIWGISNYIVFEGLVKYGYTTEAADLAEKTIKMFGRDIEENGSMHEYYDPETGIGVNNPGFQNWNFLSINMYKWLKGE